MGIIPYYCNGKFNSPEESKYDERCDNACESCWEQTEQVRSEHKRHALVGFSFNDGVELPEELNSLRGKFLWGTYDLYGQVLVNYRNLSRIYYFYDGETPELEALALQGKIAIPVGIYCSECKLTYPKPINPEEKWIQC